MPRWNGSTGGATPDQVEAACAAAIAAANLPDADGVETACGLAIVSAGLATAADVAALAEFDQATADLVEAVAQTVIAGVPGQSISVYAIVIAVGDTTSYFELADTDDVPIPALPVLGPAAVTRNPIVLPAGGSPWFTLGAGLGLKMTAQGFDASGHVTVYYKQE